MSLISTLKFVINHPLNKDNKAKAVFRFAKWQINTRLNPYPVIYPFTPKAKLIVAKGMTGATGNLYCGLHEFNDMAFLLHFLRQEDLFIDIGANIGSYTVLASAHVGAKSISIEPVPDTYKKLVQNIAVNNVQNLVTAHNCAAGSKKGNIRFTKNLDTTNHVATNNETDTIEVPVSPLDDILNTLSPSLLKIDVEGFETEVIAGAKNILANEKLKAIIIELNGSGARYGYDETKIHETLLNNNFKAYTYEPFTRQLTSANSFGTHNTIYIRDTDFVANRLKLADKIEILGKGF